MGQKVVEMGLVEGREGPQSLGEGGGCVSAFCGGRCWCSISARVVPAAAFDSLHGNVSRVRAVICSDIQRVPGWAGGACAPRGDQPPAATQKPGVLHAGQGDRPRCHQCSPGTGSHGDGTGWCLPLRTRHGEGEEGEALWGDAGSGAPHEPRHGGLPVPPSL